MFTEFPSEPAEAPPSAARRSRLMAGLLAGGLVMGVLLAIGASLVIRWYDASVTPGAPSTPRPTPALAALECGAVVREPAVSPERTLFASLEIVDGAPGATAAAGSELTVSVALVNVGESSVVARAESAVAVVALRDGVVVGRAVTAALRDPEGRDPYQLRIPTGTGWNVQTPYPLLGCDGQPLPAGDYELAAGLRVAVPDARVETELVAARVPFTVA